jgi:hypothetical protein
VGKTFPFFVDLFIAQLHPFSIDAVTSVQEFDEEYEKV